MGQRNQSFIDAVMAGGYVCLLWGSAAFVPRLWSVIERNLSWHSHVPYLIAGFFCGGLLYALPKTIFRLVGYACLMGFFFYAMSWLHRPAERIHFIEYGLLSFFLYRYFRHSIKGYPRYGATLLGAMVVGVLDELLQGLLPNRFYDLQDIGINLLSSGLGLGIYGTFLTSETL